MGSRCSIKVTYSSNKYHSYLIPSYPRLRQTRLLLINVNSLSIEVCKNLCLAGVASITVFDNTRVTLNDVEENLTLTMSSTDVDELKSVCTCRVLQQLNPRVQLVAESKMTIDQIDEKYIEQFDYVCLFNYYDFSMIAHLNKICRGQKPMDENGKKQVYFFCAGIFGLYGFVFKDLGDVYDYLR
jgi:ubiquitin-like 1-activating enzyme E1 A